MMKILQNQSTKRLQTETLQNKLRVGYKDKPSCLGIDKNGKGFFILVAL